MLEHGLVSPVDLTRLNIAFFHINSAISIVLFTSVLVAYWQRPSAFAGNPLARNCHLMSNPTTSITLVRHGHVHNPDGLIYGRLPGFRLSEAGRSKPGPPQSASATRASQRSKCKPATARC